MTQPQPSLSQISSLQETVIWIPVVRESWVGRCECVSCLSDWSHQLQSLDPLPTAKGSIKGICQPWPRSLSKRERWKSCWAAFQCWLEMFSDVRYACQPNWLLNSERLSHSSITKLFSCWRLHQATVGDEGLHSRNYVRCENYFVQLKYFCCCPEC